VTNGFAIDTTDEVVIKFKTLDSSSDDTIFTITPTSNQTVFNLPLNTSTVTAMFVNGQGTNDFSFNSGLKQVTLNTAINGYTIEATDEVAFLYKPIA
jgi:flagellar hook assembly protein FlgD